MGRRAVPLAVAAALAVLAALALHLSGALDRFEDQAVDARFSIRDERGPPSDVVVVGVDSRTLTESDRRWPFPRAEQARLIDRLRAARPRLIAYDLQITEPGESEAADFAFFDAVSRARPVLLATVETDAEGGTRVLGGDANVREAGAAVGSALFPVSGDGVVRRVGGEADGLMTFANRATELLDGRPALSPGERVWIDWAGDAGTVRAVSWSRVVRGEVPAAELRGKVVVVGLTALRLRDVNETAAGPAMPGPEIQANAIDTLLRSAPLRSASGTVDVALVVLAALLVPLIAVPLGVWAPAVVPVAAAALAVGAQLAFAGGTVIAVAAPAVALLLGAAAAGAALLVGETRRRRHLRSAFGRFVPAEVVDGVLARADPAEGLPGEEIDATVVFCDLRGFTTYTERHGAQEVLALLNRYLTEMGDAVAARGGTVVAYLGDGMMSVFGAPSPMPDHADRALAAAHDLAGPCLDRVNATVAGEPFRLGVGLHSGAVLSGTVGSSRRMEYAAVGDTTNVAARVQALTKEHGVAILLTGAVAERLAARDGLRPLGEATVRGRTEPVELWTPERPAATPGSARARPRASSSGRRR